eukprot:4425404-Alexandrium_andersonii.AAC.1
MPEPCVLTVFLFLRAGHAHALKHACWARGCGRVLGPRVACVLKLHGARVCGEICVLRCAC